LVSVVAAALWQESLVKSNKGGLIACVPWQFELGKATEGYDLQFFAMAVFFLSLVQQASRKILQVR
jgi:hypothetical protein